MSAKHDSGEVLASLVEELRYIHGTQTELISHLRSQAQNGVLEVATLQFDTNGQLTRSYNTPVGSVIVVNASAAVMTVQAGGASGPGAPSGGRSVQLVPASSWLAIPIAAHQFTVYGVANNWVSFQAFTGLQAFGIAR